MQSHIPLRVLMELHLPENTQVAAIRSKAGVHVARVRWNGQIAIVKYFEDVASRREIDGYSMLHRLKVPTIHCIASSSSALLLEDLEGESPYRLAREEDLQQAWVIDAIVRWYARLHSAGKDCPELPFLYAETDALTPEAFARIRTYTGTEGNPVWPLLEANWEGLCGDVERFSTTIVYNDFYYTNLAIGRDGASALLFDYNLLGRGYRYGDLRNVSFSLPEGMRRRFLDACAPWDPLEELADPALSALHALAIGSLQPTLPAFAGSALTQLCDGTLERNLHRWHSGG